MVVGPKTKQYIQAAVDSVAPIISSKLKPTKELNEIFIKELLGEPHDPPTPGDTLNAKERVTMKLFREIAEIHDSIERLKDYETYVGKFPFRRTRITRASYLQFVLESHLQEIYLLRERLVRHTKAVARLHRRDDQIRTICDELAKYAAQALSGFTRVRSSHVHAQRYTHPDIDRLRLIELLRKGPTSSLIKALRALQSIAANESHQRLRAQTRDWNRSVAKALEFCCTVLLKIVFEPDRKSIRFAQRTKAKHI